MVHNEDKNWSIETDPELTQMLELADNDIKTVIIAVVYIFKLLSGSI